MKNEVLHISENVAPEASYFKEDVLSKLLKLFTLKLGLGLMWRCSASPGWHFNECYTKIYTWEYTYVSVILVQFCFLYNLQKRCYFGFYSKLLSLAYSFQNALSSLLYPCTCSTCLISFNVIVFKIYISYELWFVTISNNM